MGRTIPSFRIAAEMEAVKWRDFRLALNRKDRKSFDQMLSYVRLYNSACMMVARPFVSHSVLISILFQHYKQLMQLVEKKKNGGEPTAKFNHGKGSPIAGLIRRNATLDDYFRQPNLI